MSNARVIKLTAALIVAAAIIHYFWLLAIHHLTRTSSNSNIATAGDAAEKVAHYFCPMHPSVTSDHPGTCPICGMELQLETQTKLRNDSGAGVNSSEKTDHALDGRVGFLLPEENQQLIGVRKATALRQDVDYEIKSSGRVAFDPTLYAAVSDYKIALEAAQNTKGATTSVSENAQALVAAAKLKLEILGISADQLKVFEETKLGPKNLLLPEGKAWVYADVYEYELPYLKVGQAVSAESSLFPAEKFTGTVVSISPVINPNTRTISIKTEVVDPKKLLKPDLFLTVRINVPLGTQLTVPEDSLIHTGDVELVFLFEPNGHFKPIQVKTGIRTRRQAVILSGLTEGDTVATGANFLIDSESRLRAVLEQSLQ